MKLLMLGALLLSFSAQATTEGFYVGASVGSVKFAHASDLEDSVADEFNNAPNIDTKSSDSSSGNKLVVGYGFNRYFGLEFGMYSLGQQTVEMDVDMGGANNSAQADATYTWKASAFSALLALPLGSVSPFVKIGRGSVSYTGEVKAKMTTNGTSGTNKESISDGGSGSLTGFGVHIALGKSLGLRVESESITAKDGSDLELVFQMTSAGVTWTF